MRARYLSPAVIFYLISLLLGSAFGFFLASQRVTDPFLYFDISFVKSIQPQEAMVIPKTGPYASLSLVPGRELLMAQLSNMLGIEPEVLQFLPIGAILLSQMLYLAGLYILKDPPAASLLSLYLVFNLSHATALYSVFAYAFGLPAFLAFVLIALQFLKDRRLTQLLIMLLIFVGVNLIHYTITSWVITFLLGANLAIIYVNLKKYRAAAEGGAARSYIAANSLLLVFLIIYMYFNQTIYDSFLPLISISTVESAGKRFLSLMSLTTTVDISPYSFHRSAYLGIVTTTTLLLIMLPVLIGGVMDGWRLLRAKVRLPEHSVSSILISGILVTAIIDCISYSIRGSISTKAFSILLPLVTLLYIKRLGGKALTTLAAVLLFATSLIKLGMFYQESYIVSQQATSSKIEQVRYSTEWLKAHTPGESYKLQADMNLYGKFLVSSTRTGQQPIFQPYDLDRYAYIVDPAQQSGMRRGDADIIAIDTRSVDPTVGFIWTTLTPLQDHLDAIRANQKLNIVYDDGALWLGTLR
jgi:hypothetical protein